MSGQVNIDNDVDKAETQKERIKLERDKREGERTRKREE